MDCLWRPFPAAGICQSRTSSGVRNCSETINFCSTVQAYRHIYRPSSKSLRSRPRALHSSTPFSRASVEKPSSNQQKEALRNGDAPSLVIDPKKLFALEYDYVADYLTRRDEYRQAHFQLLNKYVEQGKILLAGPCSPPHKALLIFKVNSVEEVENFVSQDPYVQNGIVVRSKAMEWHVVGGAWKDGL